MRQAAYPFPVVCVCFVLAACSSTRSVVLDGDVEQGDSAPTIDDAPRISADNGQSCAGCEILVGMLVSRSGLLAGTHEGIIDGAKLACDEINAEGGVLGMRIGLRIEDDGTAAPSALEAFERLAADPLVVAVIGPT